MDKEFIINPLEMPEAGAEGTEEMLGLNALLGQIRQIVAAKEKEIEKLRREVNRKEDVLVRLVAENEALKEQNAEQSRMTSRVVEKTDHEDLLKGIRKYLNQSKKKNSKKKSYIRMAMQELINTNGIAIPGDLQELLDSFDDEEPQLAIGQLNMGNGTQHLPAHQEAQGVEA